MITPFVHGTSNLCGTEHGFQALWDAAHKEIHKVVDARAGAV